MTPAEKHGDQIIEADAPMSELVDFAIQLRAVTQGRGSYTLKFWDYEEVPAINAQKIIADALKQE
jgi:elongation factor G